MAEIAPPVKLTKAQLDAQKAQQEALTREKQLQTIAGFLLPIHAMLAAKTEIPELAMDADEAQELAGSTIDLMDAFDFEPDPRVSAAVAFMIRVGSIYGGKVMQYKMRLAEEQGEEQPNA